MPGYPRISARTQPSLTSQFASSVPSWSKSISVAVIAILTIVPTLQRGNAVRDAPRHTAVFLVRWIEIQLRSPSRRL
ncbi:DUF1534 domain-containing protein [Pseudomonas congelans]|nr:DUF1534 domain-containing protein [Pseudomonas congelans]